MGQLILSLVKVCMWFYKQLFNHFDNFDIKMLLLGLHNNVCGVVTGFYGV